jgi:hypothetical protein
VKGSKMQGEMRDQNESKFSATKLIMNVMIVSTFALTGVGSVVAYETYMNTYQISKAKFICTKIEQIGKNMDDVICVQYTEQKFAKSAIEQSKALAYLSK